ncbi:hypothetical protein, partial [Ralstonia pseudosolanacearum]|uniref:hypothetical protein n=1 Tax=Ralstonia pseudosolanacearum TaxID=1310165 RepID=UPI003D2FF812
PLFANSGFMLHVAALDIRINVRARAPRKPAAEAPVAKAASSPAPAEPAGGKLALSAAVDQDDWTQF